MELPFLIGRYELIEYLGGGMAQVYRARDTMLPRTVAVKILSEEGNRDSEVRSRFLVEAQMSSTIVHDNIVRFYDYGEHEGRPFIVMEFLTGQSLKNAITEAKTGDLVNQISTALQVAHALEYIHAQQMIHRDIKPDNVCIDPGGRARLIDFGIAKFLGESRTRTGMAMGSPQYMAPEQVTGQPLTPATDVYAFGLLCYELFSGTKAITRDTIESVFYAILNQPLDMEPLIKKNVPAGLQELIRRCTAKNPADRIQNFDLICRELEGYLSGPTQPNTTKPAPRIVLPQGRALKPAWLGIAAAVLLACSGLAYKVFHTPSIPKEFDTPSGKMILVPEGTFLAGADKHPVSVPAFYLDRTEVSNRVYAQFLHATGHPPPDRFREDRPDEPVVNVTHFDAQAFAKWAGKRLPTDTEWERAARSVDGRLYPWGNDPDPRKANVNNNPNLPRPGTVQSVYAFSNYASPDGILNLCGNVWEWTATLEQPDDEMLIGVRAHFHDLKPPLSRTEPWYAMRGGAFDIDLSPDILVDRSVMAARLHHDNIGFRCAKTP